MDNRNVVDKIMRNLNIDLETIPKHKAPIQNWSSSSKKDPLYLKIKVKKKDNADKLYNQGFISNNLSEPEMVSQKVRLMKSDETIMTFDMLMEAEHKKTSAKPRKMFSKLNSGLCLGAVDDTDGPYLPDSSYNNNVTDGNSTSISDGILRQPFSIAKNTYETFDDSSLNRRERTFLGKKCKPGGCLDPPFGEDRYSYKPRIQEPLTPNRKTPHELEADENVNDKKHIKHDTSKTSIICTNKSGSVLNSYKTDSPELPMKTYPPKIENDLLKTKALIENRGSKRHASSIPSNDNISAYPSIDKNMLRTRVASETEPGDMSPTHESELLKIKFLSKKKELSRSPSKENKSKYLPMDESKMLRTKVDTEDSDGNTNTSSPINIGMCNNAPDESNTLRTKVSSESNKKDFHQTMPDKFRKSFNDSINSFFSPPKGIKRESAFRDSLKQHPKTPMTENKPLEYYKTPVPDSVSSHSISLEKNDTSKILNEMPLKDEEVTEQIIKSMPDSNNIHQQEINPLETPLPISVHHPVDRNGYGRDFYSAEDTTNVLEPKNSLKVTLPFENDLTISQDVAINNSNMAEQVHSESINKDVEGMFKKEESLLYLRHSGRESPLESNHNINKGDVKDFKQLITTSNNSNKNIENIDSIKNQIKKEYVEQEHIVKQELPLINNNEIIIMKTEEEITAVISSMSSVIKRKSSNKVLDYINDCVNITAEQDLDTESKFLHDNSAYLPANQHMSVEILNKSNIAPEQKLLNEKTYDVDETKDKFLPKIAQVTSSNLNKLYQKTLPSVVTQELRRASRLENVDDNTLSLLGNHADIINKTHTITSPVKGEFLDNYENEPKGILYKLTKPAMSDETQNVMKYEIPHTKKSNYEENIVFVDLAFHSYLNNQKQRILRTTDATSEVKRLPNDSFIHINSQIKLSSDKKYNALVVPVDSKYGMFIEFKKMHNEIKFADSTRVEIKSTIAKEIPRDIQLQMVSRGKNAHVNAVNNSTFGDNSINKDDLTDTCEKVHTKANVSNKVCTALTDVFEQDLVPLYMTIRHLKLEVDGLSHQQSVHQTKVDNFKKTNLLQTAHCSKRCDSCKPYYTI